MRGRLKVKGLVYGNKYIHNNQNSVMKKNNKKTKNENVIYHNKENCPYIF